MMQNEDDLRGLAKVVDFLRAVSILLILIHIYWYCYAWFKANGFTLSIIDKVLINFQKSGLFSSTLVTKLFALLLLALSCLGTQGIKNEKITWRNINLYAGIGFPLYFFNGWLLATSLPMVVVTSLYALTLSGGYIFLMIAGVWVSRLLKSKRLDDVFNRENESFMQEIRLMTNPNSVNLPTRFYYKKKYYNGWINVVNVFRASMVLGTPGSGKSYAIVNGYIKQQIEKGFAMYLYDYKYPDLTKIAYNHLLQHTAGYTVTPKFYTINFDDPRRSHRCNPLNPIFMTDISDAYEASYTIMLNLNRTWV